MIKEINLTASLSKPSINSGSLSKPSISKNLSQNILVNKDYNNLINKPSINGHELIGDKTAADLDLVDIGTTEHWNSQLSFIPKAGEIVIYSDYATEIVDGKTVDIPAFKVGDGMSYCVDLPFVGDSIANELAEHINDQIRHITNDERGSWNDKVRCYINDENLVFTIE